MKKVLKILGRVLLVLLLTLLMLTATLYGVLFIIVKGPSPSASRLFVKTVKETSAGGFMADMFLSKEEIEAIITVEASEIELNQTVDPSMISIPGKDIKRPDPLPVNPVLDPDETADPEDPSETEPSQETENPIETEPIEKDLLEGIERFDIVGPTYKGVLLVVSDPTRIFLGTPVNGYGEGKWGMTVEAMTKQYGAVVGINAGGFYDPEGRGTGSIPAGYVICDGKIVWNNANALSIMGLDENGILHVGTMTAEKALSLGMKYAVTFGPALVINGVPCNLKSSLGGGVNPRTAIGQRADGAILLLVINGRQIDSLGASFDDLVNIMLSYGAVNATNLDGGSSSLMIVNGEYVTSSAYLFGERVVANAILVK